MAPPRIARRLVFSILTSLVPILAFPIVNSPVAPERSVSQVRRISSLIEKALYNNVALAEVDGQQGRDLSSDRYSSIRDMISRERGREYEAHQLVYGELGVETLAKLLDAVGVRPHERFLDIGSGDGALVFGAKLLYPKHVVSSVGIELVPSLIARSRRHLALLESNSAGPLSQTVFLQDDIYHPSTEEVKRVLTDTTLAVCFATTWSRATNNDKFCGTSLQQRILPLLSKSLAEHMSPGARIIVVDGRLEERDFIWSGDLRFVCQDTAPYSIAFLYEKKT